MHNKAVSAAVIAVSLTLANFAFARGNDRQIERGRNEPAQCSGQVWERGNEAQRDRQARRPEDGRRAPGADANQEFRRGERLPNEYRVRT